MASEPNTPGQPLEIEVAYATPTRQAIIKLTVEAGTTAAQAVEMSGIRDKFPEIEPNPPIGVFSRKVEDNHLVVGGDRVEIYRPLQTDPKEMRRKKAERERSRPARKGH